MTTEIPVERRGVLCLSGYGGNLETPIVIIGYTVAKVRIRAIARTRLAGRLRWLEPGETTLVPRHAVREIE
ncbi:MAG: hypothetical protein LC750_16755 [Actinobacteria bacterium]|nr:hypothetical protein [Actinomycetota bacterium]